MPGNLAVKTTTCCAGPRNRKIPNKILINKQVEWKSVRTQRQAGCSVFMPSSATQLQWEYISGTSRLSKPISIFPRVSNYSFKSNAVKTFSFKHKQSKQSSTSPLPEANYVLAKPGHELQLL